jgi:hypothetical protein
MQKNEKLQTPIRSIPTDAAPSGRSSTRDETIRAITGRLAGREEELATQMVARYREEIVDYGAADDSLSADAAALARDNLEAFLANLERGEPLSSRQLEKTRMGAARRVHQGVSLESFLHACRLWGQLTWETLRAAARVDCPDEPEAALEIASRVMRHVDLISTAGAQAYLHEEQGLSNYGQVLRRDLLEALLVGERDSNRTRRRARSLGLRTNHEDDVVLGQSQAVPPAETEGQPLVEGAAVRGILEAARTHLRPSTGVLLVGVRDADVVALYPVADPVQVHTAKQQAGLLAVAIAPSGSSVGMSGWHAGLAAIALAYAEAKDAAQIAAWSGNTSRAVTLDEVLIDHIARSTPHVGRILEETLRPLVEYDLGHHTALVPTLRAYVDAGFSLTKSAEALHVHPNTVMYRLRRVKELCGRDPHEPDDLLILFLALNLAPVSPGP